MKSIELNIDRYIEKRQYLEDQKFSVSSSCDKCTLTVGVYVQEVDTRYFFRNSEIKLLCVQKKKLDNSKCHGATRKLVDDFNKIIEEYKIQDGSNGIITRSCTP